MSPTPWDAWTSLWSSGLRMAETSRKIAETVTASQEVVDSRVRKIAEAATDPFGGDYAELGRMVPEKVDAFGQAGAAAFGDLMAMQAASFANFQQLTALALSGRPPTPGEAGAIWARSCGIVERAMGAGDKALAPVHRRVTANARRLRKGAKR